MCLKEITRFKMKFFYYRDSVESLNYKFDEKSSSTTSIFSINFAEINSELTKYDLDLGNAENWADLQSEEVFI